MERAKDALVFGLLALTVVAGGLLISASEKDRAWVRTSLGLSRPAEMTPARVPAPPTTAEAVGRTER